MPDISVKICGLTTKEAVLCAVQNGADFIGFVFYGPSPRNIEITDAVILANYALNQNPDVKIVAVMVNPSDSELDEIKNNLCPDYIQLHGNEDIARIIEIKNMGFKIIKAIGIEKPDDLINAQAFFDIAEHMLFDAKPPKNSDNVGGFGISFDWSILADNTPKKPWFLSGGLNPLNVKDAILQTNVQLVDVSSGVESSKGIKDLDKIAEFIKNAKCINS